MDAESLDRMWHLVLGAARWSERLSQSAEPAAFTQDDDGELQPPSGDAAAVLEWDPATGWTTRFAEDDPRRAFADLYLPLAGATTQRPLTIGHLGQSLDGFIATRAGESRYVTGGENIVHLHRLRALSDAVVVGAGTVAADDPQLTTRLVRGPNPLRVVVDPGRRLDDRHRILRDTDADTLYMCSRSLMRPGEARFGRALIVGLEDHPEGPGDINAAAVMAALRARGCHRVFVEGGGVTVSAFLEARLLDRLHVAIAPLLIGDGRPAIRLATRDVLGECPRPAYRVFRMGGDVLFDCDLTAAQAPAGDVDGHAPVQRVI